ncbi:hypothetical protein Hanom_Chr09g00853461 [Helianthus anomalus]
MCGRAGHLVFGGPRSRNKRGFTKMALTWATGVRFGRVTRRNERENELYLAANGLRRFGSSFRPKKRLFLLISYFHFYVFSSILGILFLGLCLVRCLF